MNARETFNDDALAFVSGEVDRLKAALTFSEALALPEAIGKDIVIAGKEVQLTTWRQIDLPFLKNEVLVTVQVARFGLGGMVSYHTERGLVFSPDAPTREATLAELQNSGG